MMYYFAYGSNMDVTRLEHDRLNREGVWSVMRTLGRLDDFGLVFDKPSAYFIGAGAANIRPQAGAQVYGTLNLMADAGFAILDRYENVASGGYERIGLTVFDCEQHRPVDAIAYISRENVEGLKPTAAYMNHLLAGADLLPAAYVRSLKSIPLMPA